MKESQKKANSKYLAKFDEFRIRMPKGKRAEYQAVAALTGESMNALILRLLEEEKEWRTAIAEGEKEAEIQSE